MRASPARWLRGGLFAAALATCLACHAQAPTAPAQPLVLQPRSFGYTVGDIASQRVLLPQSFEPASLPAAARTSAWLERRAARVEAAADGQRWLVVDYQVVNAPRALATIPVPAWELPGPAGTLPLRVPGTSISVGPLTAPAAPGQALPLRPDRAAPAIDTAAMEGRLRLWIGALAATLVAWLAWLAWTGWRARSTQPFARAMRDLRAQRAAPTAAHLALHRAFDQTAGQIVHANTLATLFERAPYLQPQRPQIEHFYAQSAALFFGEGLPADALSPQALCQRLRRLERRHAA